MGTSVKVAILGGGLGLAVTGCGSPMRAPSATGDTGATEATTGDDAFGNPGTGATTDPPPLDVGDDGLARPPAESGFVDVTVQAGLDLHPGASSGPPSCLLDDVGQWHPGDFCMPQWFLGAAAAEDFDGDGWIDLYLARSDGPDRLMRNMGDGTFEDVATSAGLNHAVATGAIAWADVDNDGDLDLVASAIATQHNYLFVNDGAGHFDDQGVDRGIAVDTGSAHVGTGVAVGDYDLDGFVDLFIADWHPDEILGNAANHNRLLHNLGAAAPGVFEDVTDQVGIDLPALAAPVDAKPGAYGFAPAFVDLDSDGWPELVLTADFGTSRLYWNDGQGGFDDLTAQSGVGTERNGMGSTFADYDGDGDLDWFVSAIWSDDFPELGHRLYRNDGGRMFTDVSDVFGLRDRGWGWGAAFFDVENDGDPDLAMTAGWPLLGYDADPFVLWINDGGGPWSDEAQRLGLAMDGRGRMALPFDFDRDGDLDLLVTGNETPPRLYRNDVARGDWLTVRAPGTTSNRQGLGAVVHVQVTEGGPVRVGHIGAGSHLFGHEPARAHFGLATGDGPIARVTVRWPASGIERTRRGVARNAVLTVVE